MSVKLFSFACALILAMSIKYSQSAEIFEEPKTQYALIGKNATFTCKASGREAYWTLNNIPLSVTHEKEKHDFENMGVVFIEDVQGQYHNLTMIIHASLDLNNTKIFCTALGSDFNVMMSQEICFIVFNTLRPYSPTLNVSISYVENPTVMATISEIPRWPGYEVVEFKMNITESEDNTVLGRYNASAENATVKIHVPLPDSIIDQCVTLKISASAVSEQYGEGEATVTYTELFKTPGFFTDQGVIPIILPHTNDSLFHVSLAVKLPDVCKNQKVKYSFVIENDNSSEIVEKRGPYNHHGPGNVSYCIDGLNKNNSYSVVVQVESVAGNRDSEPTYLNTSNIKSCPTEDTDITSTPVQTTDDDTAEETIEKDLQKETALIVVLVVVLVILVGVSGVFIWFCSHHHHTLQKKAQSYEHSTTVKKVMVHNPIYSEPMYDKVGGPPQITIPPVPLSASDTQSINSSPPVGTPTPLLSTHYGHQGQKFIYEGKMCKLGLTVVPLPQEPDEPYTMMSPAPGSPKSPKEKGLEA